MDGGLSLLYVRAGESWQAGAPQGHGQSWVLWSSELSSAPPPQSTPQSHLDLLCVQEFGGHLISGRRGPTLPTGKLTFPGHENEFLSVAARLPLITLEVDLGGPAPSQRAFTGELALFERGVGWAYSSCQHISQGLACLASPGSATHS